MARPFDWFKNFLDPLTVAGNAQTWPPTPKLAADWKRSQEFQRRFKNKKEEMIAYAPMFSSTAYGQEIFTPLAVGREVCLFSADMLFSAPPKITYDKNPDKLDEILKENKLNSRAIEMAGIVAAEGRGALRIIRDPAISDVPLITHVHNDQLIWQESHGAFVRGGSVVIEREKATGYTGGSGVIYRLIEHHTRGLVERRLYRGTATTLGSRVDLKEFDEFATLQERENTGVDKPTLVRWDNVPGGYSDMEGAEAVLDAINIEVTRGMEKSDKSRPIRFADGALFDEAGNADLGGVIPLRRGKLLDLEETPEKLFGVIQPDFASDAQISWLEWLIDGSLTTMGYSKASYGRDQGGSADSGKALRIRQSRTLLKKAGKDLMVTDSWVTAIAIALAMELSGESVSEHEPTFELGDGLPRDALEDAQEAAAWGDSISLEERVRLRRPDYTDEQVDEEIARIEKRQRIATTPRVPTLNLGGLRTGADAATNGGGS